MAVVQHIALLLKVIVFSTFKLVCKQEVTPPRRPVQNPVVSRIEYAHQLSFSIGFLWHCTPPTNTHL